MRLRALGHKHHRMSNPYPQPQARKTRRLEPSCSSRRGSSRRTRAERMADRCIVGAQTEQSTATARAAQISRMRGSATRPNRWTRMATETLSTESRLTAERSGTGSSPGSRTTSLASPRIVVVQGATSARRCRGITTSRGQHNDRTASDLGDLAPLDLPPRGEGSHDAAAALRNEARSPHPSGSSSGCSSYVA